MPPDTSPETRRWLWVALIALLIAVRLPSLVEPAGGDQGLYAYTGERILAGGVTYRDMWDQKPPAIGFLYAALLQIWPHESIVPAADLAAAIGVACLLVVLGRRRCTEAVGFGAAVLFLLFGDPYLQRLSGIYVRGQCEPFVALAVVGGLVIVAGRRRTSWRMVAAGIALAAAFWLKYNAGAYGLPVALGTWAWRSRDRPDKAAIHDLAWIGVGFAVLSAAFLAYFAVHGALIDWRLATIDYNLHYSNQTYEGPASMIRYVLTFPIERARIDMIWFLGGLGAVLLLRGLRTNRSALVILGWLVAAVISIAINGSRSLPNYFVQANPALAFAASAGLATMAAARSPLRFAVAAALVAALWRVGADTPVWGMRLAGLPGLVYNVRYDWRYLTGQTDRDAYLERFSGQKHDVLENAALVRYIRQATPSADRVFVFGFSGGSVCWLSHRISSSRFFWSLPVIIEFAADRPGYGPAGLLEDLRQHPPALLALQKEQWRSYDFFMSNDLLRPWLEANYRLDHESRMFSVWLRR